MQMNNFFYYSHPLQCLHCMMQALKFMESLYANMKSLYYLYAEPDNINLDCQLTTPGAIELCDVNRCDWHSYSRLLKAFSWQKVINESVVWRLL